MHHFSRKSLLNLFLISLLSAVFGVWSPLAAAQETTNTSELLSTNLSRLDDLKQMQSIYRDARLNQFDGPHTLELDEIATLEIPLGYSFINTKHSHELLALMGNPSSNDLLGIVVATHDMDMNWFIALSHSPVGYIKDQAGDVNPEKLLETLNAQLQKANESSNQKYKIDQLSWLIEPEYNQERNQLSWLLNTKVGELPQEDKSGQGINFKQIQLYRNGFISINLATALENQKYGVANARAIANNLKLKKGKRYQDFEDGDKVANFDINAFIAGVPASSIAEPEAFVDNAKKVKPVTSTDDTKPIVVKSKNTETSQEQMTSKAEPNKKESVMVAGTMEKEMKKMPAVEHKASNAWWVLLWAFALAVLAMVVLPTVRQMKLLDKKQ